VGKDVIATSEPVVNWNSPFEEDIVTPLGVFDFDADGHPELVFSNSTYAGETFHDTGHVLSYRDGAVATYAPSEEFAEHIEELNDVDGDGRPDMLTSDRFAAGDHGHFYGCHAGFFTLRHTLPDGTFSYTDEAARRYLKKQCPRPPGARLFIKAKEPEQAYERLICMWLWGDSVENIRARLDAEWPTHGCNDSELVGDCMCSKQDFDELLAWLVQNQPQVLAAASAAQNVPAPAEASNVPIATEPSRTPD
jgi:hypothetical protein